MRMSWLSRHGVWKIDSLMLAFFALGSFVGIWHALPMLNVILDEQYFVGGVLRAIEAKSILPLATDVPYGTITFYLNYALQIPFLITLLAWNGFSIVSLKTYLVLHPETAYLVPRLLSAIVASAVALAYDRFLRSEGLSLVQRFAVLSVIFSTVIATVTLHTGKVWVLSTVLAGASALCTYIALRNYSLGRPEPTYGPAFWSIVLVFTALANFPLAGVFLINVPLLLYVFRNDAVRLRATGKAILAGILILFAVLAANWSNIYSLVIHIFTNFHPILNGGMSTQVVPPFSTSLVFHFEQALVAPYDDQDWYQRLRPHRPQRAALGHPELQRHRSRGHQRPSGARVPRVHAAVRLGAWPLQGRSLGRGQHPGRQRQEDPPHARARPRQPEVERSRRRRGDRIHRPVPGQGHRAEAPGRWCQEGHPVGPLQGRHPHVRVRREPRHLRGPSHHLQRIVHHQLPGSRGQGAERQVGHQARPDDHRARCHRHAKDRGRPFEQGLARRPRHSGKHHPLQHRCCQGGGRGDPCAEQEADRHVLPRAHLRRVGGGPDGGTGQGCHLRRNKGRDEGPVRRRAQGRSGLHRRQGGRHRLPWRHPHLDL